MVTFLPVVALLLFLHTWPVFPDHSGELPADRTGNGEKEAFKAQESSRLRPATARATGIRNGDGLSTEAPGQADGPGRWEAGSVPSQYMEVGSTPMGGTWPEAAPL